MAASVKPVSVGTGSLPTPTTPQAFATWLDAHLNHGKPLPGLPSSAGSTIGANWLWWYAQKYAADGSKYTLLEYEEAFVAYAAFDLTGDIIGSGAAGAVGATGTAVNAIPPALGSAFSWTDGLSNLLGTLGSSAFWLRAAKVVLGGALLLIGLAHLTGADGAIMTAARRAPIPV